jgi:hypothetical protein
LPGSSAAEELATDAEPAPGSESESQLATPSRPSPTRDRNKREDVEDMRNEGAVMERAKELG